MAFFKENGNVWLVTIHTYNDGEHWYGVTACDSYETAKTKRDSFIEEAKNDYQDLEGFTNEIFGDGNYTQMQTPDCNYWFEINITKDGILTINKDNEQL